MKEGTYTYTPTRAYTLARALSLTQEQERMTKTNGVDASASLKHLQRGGSIDVFANNLKLDVKKLILKTNECISTILHNMLFSLILFESLWTFSQKVWHNFVYSFIVFKQLKKEIP